VNVLLVPAHPGFPGQIPQSRKTVVCVVCVHMYDTVITLHRQLNNTTRIYQLQVLGAKLNAKAKDRNLKAKAITLKAKAKNVGLKTMPRPRLPVAAGIHKYYQN